VEACQPAVQDTAARDYWTRILDTPVDDRFLDHDVVERNDDKIGAGDGRVFLVPW